MAKKVIDPGFGTVSSESVKRLVNQDGTFNIKHLNHRSDISSAYSYLVNISWTRFFGLVILGYLIVNALFACIYLLIGVEDIVPPSGSLLRDFMSAFFFSAQTVTTVGYGAMSPNGVGAGIISTIEALIGLLSFSFVTGLLYGRFAKPKASIKFSENMVYREHKDGHAIMFRLMNRRTKIMIQPRIAVTLAISEEENGSYKRSFYGLQLERNNVTYLPTTWTIVHEIDEKSPLKKFAKEEMKDLDAELLILASYYDESFNQEVHQVHSYTMKELLLDQHFEKAFYYDDEGNTILDHQLLNSTKSTRR